MILWIAKEYCKHPCLLVKPPEAAPKATRALGTLNAGKHKGVRENHEDVKVILGQLLRPFVRY
jgi:hypothetical protein